MPYVRILATAAESHRPHCGTVSKSFQNPFTMSQHGRSTRISAAPSQHTVATSVASWASLGLQILFCAPIAAVKLLGSPRTRQGQQLEKIPGARIRRIDRQPGAGNLPGARVKLRRKCEISEPGHIFWRAQMQSPNPKPCKCYENTNSLGTCDSRKYFRMLPRTN